MVLRRFFLFVFLLFSGTLSRAQLIADFCFCDASDLPNSLMVNPEGMDAISINPAVQSDGEGAFMEINEGIQLELPRGMFKDSESLKMIFDVYRNEDHFTLFEMGDFVFFQWRDSLYVNYLTGDGNNQVNSGYINAMEFQERAKFSFTYVKNSGKAYLHKNDALIWETPDTEVTPGEPIFLPNQNALAVKDLDGSGAGVPVLFSLQIYANDCPTLPTPTADNISECGPGTFTLEANSSLTGVIYSWYDSANYFEPIQENTDNFFTTSKLEESKRFYVAVEKDGCTSNKTEVLATIKDLPDSTLSISPADTIICNGESVLVEVLSPEAEVNYRLFQDEVEITQDNSQDGVVNLDTGPLQTSSTFTINAVSAENGCSTELTEQLFVTVQNSSGQPTIQSSTGGNQVCTADSATLFTTSAAEYQWLKDGEAIENFNQATVHLKEADDSGIYEVKVKEEPNSCFSDFSEAFSIEVSQTPDAPATSDTSRCGPGVLVLAASGAESGEYHWYLDNDVIEGENDNTYTTPELNESQTYSVAIEKNNCLSPVSEIEAGIKPVPDADAGEDQLIKKGNEATLKGSGGTTYSWSPSENIQFPNQANAIASPLETTTYTLMVENDAGCTAEDEVTVTVRDQLVYVPTSFSPNNDGLNDTWKIVNIERFPECKVYIFNRWGNLIYYSDGYSRPWDGRIAGEFTTADTYVFKIILDEQEEPIRGSLTVIL